MIRGINTVYLVADLCLNKPYHVRFCDVIWRTDYGGKNEFLVFMDAEDSLEGLVKVATRKKV